MLFSSVSGSEARNECVKQMTRDPTHPRKEFHIPEDGSGVSYSYVLINETTGEYG